MDSRLLPTHILGEAIVRCANPPHVWINASTATIYRHTFGAAWDESGEIAATREAKDEFSVQVATEWERALNSFRTPRTRKLLLRSAMVLGTARNSVFPALRRLVRLGLGGSLAGGRQFVSWIHERDFCGAVDWLIEHHDLDGAFNVSSPMPVTNAEMMRALREVCGRHIGLPTSRLMLELGAVFLRTETELIIKSRWVVPGRLLGSGFEFQFPEIQRALQDLEGNWVPVASGPARGHFPN
jgi:uncharacterized protein (TIGR01777 family)